MRKVIPQRPSFKIWRGPNENGLQTWYVLKDGETVLGPLSSQFHADSARERLERKAKQKRRKCLTCEKSFMSEGPHNRMCDGCRSRRAEEPPEYRLLAGGSSNAGAGR